MQAGFRFVHIHDRSAFIEKVRSISPRSPEYRNYWREQRRRCIEGIWRKQKGKWRYMPGRLYFYGHFGTVEQTLRDGTRRAKTPFVRDIEWERAYVMSCCEGFSGFEGDDEYTCFRDVEEKSVSFLEKWAPNALRANGTKKKYKEAHAYIRSTHDKDLGLAVWENQARNVCEIGSRGGGKSYSVAQMELAYGLLFDGLRRYMTMREVEDAGIKWTGLIGSGDKGKTADLMNKVEECINGLQRRTDLGCWGRPGEKGFEACPLAKIVTGSKDVNNKENPYITQYKKKINGKWTLKGTGSKINHVVYAINSRTGAEKGAGGRYNYVLYEEVGLTELVEEAWGSNKGAVKANGIQFGVQKAIGTSGNIETIGPAKKIFCNPHQFECFPFRNMDGESGDTGFFLSAIYCDDVYKDEQGNTNVEDAAAEYDRLLKQAAASDLASALSTQQMNSPTRIFHMWQNGKTRLLPAERASDRIKWLEKGGRWNRIAQIVEPVDDPTCADGIYLKLKEEAGDPINEFPLVYSKQRRSFEGEILVYDRPVYEHNPSAPDDLYWAVYDPVDADGMYRGASMHSLQIWMNPLYWGDYLRTTPMVATYFGRPDMRDEFYSRMTMLMEAYGAKRKGRMLFHENDKGDHVEMWYKSCNKLHYLIPDPKKDHMAARVVTYGWRTGTEENKLQLISSLNEELKSPVTLPGGKEVDMISTIYDLQFLRQISYYNLEGNFDAISSGTGFPQLRLAQQAKLKTRSDNPRTPGNRKRTPRSVSFATALGNV